MTVKEAGSRTPDMRNREDELVPFVRERLIAAMREAGLSQRELANRVGVSQQHLNYIVRRAKKCRASVLEAVGDELQTGTEWLTGARDSVFLQIQTADSENTAFGALIAAQFLNRCRRAYLRDMRENKSVAERERRRRSEGEFYYAVNSLIQPQAWWNRLFMPESDFDGDCPYWEIIGSENRDYPPAEEMNARFTAAVVAALDIVLEPWFKGVGNLDYRRVVELVYPQIDPAARGVARERP